MKAQKLKALIIEDNEGDFTLIKHLLDDEIPNNHISHAENFVQAETLLQMNDFDIILLDLTLPDCSGNELVVKIVKLASSSPVLVLTGYLDKQFGIQTLALGVSDYLLKDELTGQQLKKTVLYSMERVKINSKLKESEEKYRAIFHGNPLPTWIYDIESYDFLDVNEAAIQRYGFGKDEFMSMNFKDLIPDYAEESHREILQICNNTNGFLQTVCYHLTKDNEIIKVELQSNEIEFKHQKARLIVAHDITQKTNAEEALKSSEQRFRALVQKGSDVFSILDQSGEYLYVGENSTSILGLIPKSFENQSFFKFIHPEDIHFVKQAFSSVFELRSVRIEPYRFLSSAGYVWLETIITDMMDDPSVAGIVANSKNVSDKIEGEMKLKSSNERYNMVSRATSNIVWDCDLVQKCVTWNRGLSRTFGYPKEMQTTSTDWALERIHPADVRKVTTGIQHNISNRIHLWQEEYRFRCSNGSYRHVFDRGFVIFDENGKALRLIGAMQDITQQKIEEQRLKLFESVVTDSSDAVILFAIKQNGAEKTGFNGEITYVNEVFTKITGIERSNAVGNSIEILKTLKISRKNLLHSLRSLHDCQSFGFELSYSNQKEEVYFLNLSMTPVTDALGKLTHWSAIVNDITERTKKEHEITKAIMGAQELERYEIGCELHDNINQILSATQLALGMTKEASDPEDAMHWVNQAGSYIDLAIEEIRRLSHRLAPNSLDGTTFNEAVISLVRSLNVSNRIHFALQINSQDFEHLGSEVQINLYRIIQEQLNNIIKHSRAKNVTIHSSMSDNTLIMKIKDDGIGFNIYTVKKGIGLNNIAKRCDMIHARQAIVSETNKGCELVIEFDVKEVKI